MAYPYVYEPIKHECGIIHEFIIPKVLNYISANVLELDYIIFVLILPCQLGIPHNMYDNKYHKYVIDIDWCK